MKIQEASKDFIKGGILCPSSKTSYNEENTSKSEEKQHFSISYCTKAPKHTGWGLVHGWGTQLLAKKVTFC